MTLAGALTTLDWFTDVSGQGFLPVAGLVQGPDGALYGATQRGGLKGWGTAFKTTTNGALTALIDFNLTDGNGPSAAMIQGADGGLYGTTLRGGANNDGAAFRIATNGKISTLASFNYTAGAEPTKLFQAANGNFYGTTIVGGIYGDGSVFEISSNGTLTSLASFNYTNNGSLPYDGLVPTPDGNFLGTTYEGGAYGFGTVFEVTPAGALTTVYSFTGGSDGSHPAAGLIIDSGGNFCGTTAYGGAYNDGAIFRLALNGGLVSLVQLDGFDGANPESALVLGADGNFYGATANGGAGGAGVLFRVNINYPAVQITGQPADQDVFAGENVIFSVAVAGNPPFYYQWKEDGTNLTDRPGYFGFNEPHSYPFQCDSGGFRSLFGRG